ncbi:MAG: geranylgeranyl reductase family protein [Candidatus Thorarchaeota archaeon]
MHDLIVVGGGPAGATCARKAAQWGLDVLLIEKEIHPRRKLCGGAVSPRITEVLDCDFSSGVDLKINAASLYTPSEPRVTYQRTDFTGYLVKRDVFDSILMKKAIEAGVTVEQGQRVVAVEQLHTGIRVLTEGDSFKGQLLVGADGVNSTIARETGIRIRWAPKNVGLCISADVPMSQSDIHQTMSLPDNPGTLGIEIYFGVIDWGYGWCFPKRDEISVGIGCRMDKIVNLREDWKRFVKFIQDLKDIEMDLSTRSAFRIPFGGDAMRKTSRRTMLVGDAAGLVSPVSGEGIYYAVASGVLAAEVAIESVQRSQPLHTRFYDEKMRKTLDNELGIARFISNILYRKRTNAETMCGIAARDMIMREYMIDLFAGSRSYSELRRLIVKRLLTHHPLKAIRLGF